MTKAYDEVVDFIASGSTRQEVALFQSSAEVRLRVESLVLKEKSGGLLLEEKRELDQYLQLEHLMRLTKAKARSLLSGE